MIFFFAKIDLFKLFLHNTNSPSSLLFHPPPPPPPPPPIHPTPSPPHLTSLPFSSLTILSPSILLTPSTFPPPFSPLPPTLSLPSPHSDEGVVVASRGLPTVYHYSSEVIVGAHRGLRPVSRHLLVRVFWDGDLLPCRRRHMKKDRLFSQTS